MFERYTEKARRAIFFARYEASVWGSQYIETSHLLLGLLREDKRLFSHLLHEHTLLETAAVEMALKANSEMVSTSVDLPLSHESKRVLAYSAEEAERLKHPQVGPGHLLLGLLREPGAACDLLEKRGLRPPAVRDFLRDMNPTSDPPPTNERIIAELREQFNAMTTRLKPEMEPAVLYSLRAENPQ